MKKVLDWICLGIWIFELVTAAVQLGMNKPISPGIAIGAIIICIIFYVEELINDYL